MDEPGRLWELIAIYIRQRAMSSQKLYLKTLEYFCEVTGITMGTEVGALRFLSVNAFDIEKFLHAIKNRQGVVPREEIGSKKQNTWKASKSTISVKICVMKAIYNELVADGLLQRSPFRHVRTYEKGEERRQVSYAIPIEKVSDLFDACEKDTRSGALDKAILAMLFGGGLRVGELAKIRVCDVHKSASGAICARLRETKGRADVDQTLARWAGKIILDWKVYRTEIEGCYPTDPLLATVYRSVKFSIDTRTITRRFKRLCEAAGLDSRLYSSHSARHTVITKMFLDGLPSIVVKNFARHQSLVTTQKYFSKLEQSVDASKSLNFFDIKED